MFALMSPSSLVDEGKSHDWKYPRYSSTFTRCCQGERYANTHDRGLMDMYMNLQRKKRVLLIMGFVLRKNPIKYEPHFTLL